MLTDCRTHKNWIFVRFAVKTHQLSAVLVHFFMLRTVFFFLVNQGQVILQWNKNKSQLTKNGPYSENDLLLVWSQLVVWVHSAEIDKRLITERSVCLHDISFKGQSVRQTGANYWPFLSLQHYIVYWLFSDLLFYTLFGFCKHFWHTIADCQLLGARMR